MSDEATARRESIAREDLLVDVTLRYWWQRRRFIILAMLIAVLTFTAILFMIPTSYKAQAAIIILPPRFIPEVRTQPLTVITAKSLLETNELYQQVIQRLRRYHHVAVTLAGDDDPTREEIEKIATASEAELMSDNRVTKEDAAAISELGRTEIRALFEFRKDELADMTVDSVSQSLWSMESIEKKTASQLDYSPVLQLFAVADTGNKAQIMVNLWARLFEEKYETLTRGQTQKLFKSLENQQTAGQEEMEAIQGVIVDFKLKNNLELIQRQISDFSQSFSAYTKRLVEKSDELVTLQAKSNSYNTLVDSLEGPNYSWIGSVAVDLDTSRPDGIRFLPIIDDDVTSAASTVVRRRRGETLQNHADLINSLKNAATYNANSQIELMIAERDRLKAEYLQEKTKYRSSLVEVQVAQESLDKLDNAVEETSQSVPLMTALPDEVLGEVLTSGDSGEIEKVASIHLNKEQLNPLWETLVKQRAEVARSFYEAQATVDELGKGLADKESELRAMSEKIFLAQQGEKLVMAQVGRHTTMNEKLFDDFVRMKEEIFKTGWEITMLQDEVASLEKAVQNSRTEIEVHRKAYEAASATLEILELRKKAVTQRADLLTQKLQESMVAIREEVSDVSLASKAVAPTRHYFPPRTWLLAGMTFLTGAILLGGLSRKRYRQLIAE